MEFFSVPLVMKAIDYTSLVFYYIYKLTISIKQRKDCDLHLIHHQQQQQQLQQQHVTNNN